MPLARMRLNGEELRKPATYTKDVLTL